MERDLTVDIAKGIGIIFVIVGHLNHFFSYEGLVLTIIYSFHMPLFLILSGYVFNYHPEISTKEYCWRRFGQIMKPYFVFAVITYIFDYVKSGGENAGGIYGILIGNGIDNHLNFNIALWFLPMLFCCNIVFWCSVKISKRVKKELAAYVSLVLLSVFWTLLGYYAIMHQARFYWGVETALFSQSFMLLGYTFKILNKRYCIDQKYKKVFFCFVPAIAIIWWKGAKFNGRIDMNAGHYGNIFLFFGVAICGIYLVWQLSYLVSKIPVANTVLNRLGKDSLYIMAYHIPAAYIVYNIILPFMPNIIKNNAWKPNGIGISYIVIVDILIALSMKLLHLFAIEQFDGSIGKIIKERYMCINDKTKKMMIFISCLFGFLIFLQHHYVFIVFDDYGYGSLSYGWTGNQSGMSYTLRDIFDFLSWHYFNWGGRILCFFVEILVLRGGGAELIQITQAVIVLLICILSGKIIAVVTKCDVWCSVALSLVFYGTINLSTLRDGVYWYSASVSYVWPLLPLLAGIYFYLLLQIKETNFRKCATIFLIFIASFSQEQISVLVIVWVASILFFTFWKERSTSGKKNIPHYLYGMAVSAVLGGMITIFAPGNFVRAGTTRYDEFYSMSFFEKIAKNTAKIININIGNYNWVFTLIMTVFCGVAAAIYLKNKRIHILTCIFSIYFITEKVLAISFEIGIVVRLLWAVCFFCLLLLYYYRRGNYLFFGMLAAGICSQGMMLVSPTITVRCHVPMEFILHIVVVECIMSIYISDVYTTKRVYQICLAACITGICIYAAYNSGNITSGYKHNDEINKINHYKLLEAQARYIAGDEIKEVDLYKLRNDNYSNCMPYHSGFDYIEVWMKNYYELPQDIYFAWHNIEDTMRLYIKSGNYYDDHWLGEKAVFDVKADEERILRIKVRNAGNVENEQLICTIAGEESVFDIPDGETGFFDIVIPQGNNELMIQAAQTFSPTTGDMRELSVMIDFLY